MLSDAARLLVVKTSANGGILPAFPIKFIAATCERDSIFSCCPIDAELPVWDGIAVVLEDKEEEDVVPIVEEEDTLAILADNTPLPFVLKDVVALLICGSVDGSPNGGDGEIT
mmetsp:Transcript_22887/g.47993  ORF Transcript_22887/g.47993 Transcript_22887/m.47993 type:complete len:113 (-) Transcript_22887:1083-1421(-)